MAPDDDVNCHNGFARAASVGEYEYRLSVQDATGMYRYVLARQLDETSAYNLMTRVNHEIHAAPRANHSLAGRFSRTSNVSELEEKGYKACG